MNVRNVKLILGREIRDQLRDRRTMFMIFVLPILLYPLLGLSFLQISQFMQEQPTRVLVVGARDLGELPALFENDRFAAGLFKEPERARLLEVKFESDEPRDEPPLADPQRREEASREKAERRVQTREFDAALCIPPDFSERLSLFRQAMKDRAANTELGDAPNPLIVYSTAHERSMIAFARLSEVLGAWKEQIVESHLQASRMPVAAARPFAAERIDVAGDSGLRGAATWAKILPMLLVLWAMTGAFYPAVDLCAGEKERGTLETLLSSPAQRSEIVLGKLATIMLFSMATAALNLIAMGVTGWAVVAQFPALGSPPPYAVVWLALAMLPVAALFSALSLALAAFARSSKEGQYYLMPLMLVTMPLVVMPMSPSMELNLGTSLIPVTGLVLLLRSVLEGGYWQGLQFLPPVAAVTLGCCWLAIRWAVEQFNAESVLFRESERLDVGLWLRHLHRDRQPTPTVAEAVFCGVVILAVRFFMGLAMKPPEDFDGFVMLTLASQLVVILTPALLMTAVLAGSAKQTLLLRRPRALAVPAAALLAVVLHPVAVQLASAVQRLYPITGMEAFAKHIEALTKDAPFWQILLLMALTPAICEELAFRGCILSGFRHLGHKWRAIIYSALFFGVTHAILQQSLIAALVGVVIGYIAVQTGSILPGMVFHAVHNGLMLSISRLTPATVERWPLLGTLMYRVDDGWSYHWGTVVLGGLAAALLWLWFGRLAYTKSPEEELQEAIERGSEEKDED
jgi:sodium transport system permease protein